MSEYIWVGPRESDIRDCESLFTKSITIFGSGTCCNTSFSRAYNLRIDHNDENDSLDDFFESELLKALNASPDAKLMYYDGILSERLPKEYRDRVVCLNSIPLLKALGSKCQMRSSLCSVVPTVPFFTMEEGLDRANALLDAQLNAEKLVVQENRSSGGFGTHVLDKRHVSEFAAGRENIYPCLVSPYFEQSIPINVHLVIYDKEVIVLPGSVQIVRELDGKLLYLGADFPAYDTIAWETREAVLANSLKIGREVASLGYRGVLGIDFIIVDGVPLFTEINARFQSSSGLLNKALTDASLPCLQQMQLEAFSGGSCSCRRELAILRVHESMLAYVEGSWTKGITHIEAAREKDPSIKRVERDGFDEKALICAHAYLFRIVFEGNISSISPDSSVWIHENLLDIPTPLSARIREKDPLACKLSLLNQGVRISKAVQVCMEAKGGIRKAVFDAVDLTIFDSLQVNCPTGVRFNQLSPWLVDVRGETFCLTYQGALITEVRLDLTDSASIMMTTNNVSYATASFWATDRVRLHHTPSCIFKQNGVGCRFCEVPANADPFMLEDVLEMADYYLCHEEDFDHFLIGGGSENAAAEHENIRSIAAHIRNRSDKGIYAMCLPPSNIKVLRDFYEAGVTEIGFNIELFDRRIAREFMPGKGAIPLAQYLDALSCAVDIWGSNGQVRTAFIAGLEPFDSLMQGVATVCAMGVMPIISVFRPLSGTETESLVPPENAWLSKVYEKAQDICLRNGLYLGPSCEACQNNTLSMPSWFRDQSSSR